MSLFNRPAWARTHTVQDDETEDSIFSHSNRPYADILKAEQRLKEERKYKERLKQEKKERSSGKRETKEQSRREHRSSPKRRRITLEEGEDLLGRVGMPSAAPKSPTVDTKGTTQRQLPSINKDGSRDSPWKAESAQPLVVELGDSPERDDDLEIDHVQPAPRVLAPEDDESDVEFAELARQARARKLREESAKSSQKPDVKSPTPGEKAAAQSRTAYATPPAPDPAVKLFINSRIPDTKPLMVIRKLSQRLQEIRKVWCQKQDFTEERTESVFLIHRMRRVFDVTTCRSLGLDTDADGNVIMKGADGMDGVDQVHLEAVTDEIFAQLKAERERDERRRQGLEVPEDDAVTGAAEASAAAEEPLIRIVLKARGQRDFKLKVKPSTQISKIMQACCPQFKVQPGQSVSLEMDGERLEPDARVSDTEISDMDNIDVHISRL